MSDELLRSMERGSAGGLLDSLIQDQVNLWTAPSLRDRFRVTSEVISLTKQVVARTLGCLAAEQGCGNGDGPALRADNPPTKTF